jgi:hypothetical protein
MQTYTIKPTTTEEFYQAFIVHAGKIIGEPAYDDIRQLRNTAYQNAAAVSSALGGGQHGHLGMIMDATTYASLTQEPWTDPPEPPTSPVIPPQATGPIISEAHRAHAQALKERRECQNLDRALTRLIVEAIEPLFLKPLHQPYIGLLGKTTKEILAWLMSSYGRILPQELETNRELLAKPYDATSEPFQILLDRYEEARTVANDGKLAITDAQLINSGIVALQNTGVLDRIIDQWNDKNPNDRSTWIQFKEHFQPKILEYQKGKRGGSPQYGMAAAYCQEIRTSTPPNELIMDANVMAMMAAAQTEVLKQLAAMQEQVNALANQKTPKNNSSGSSQGGNKGEKYYCFTHGFSKNENHTSKTCNRPDSNHKKEATADNTMGGYTGWFWSRKPRGPKPPAE